MGVHGMDKRRLTWPKQWLIEQCQRINFGRITLHVQGGEPDLTRPWKTRRTVKLASGTTESVRKNGPRREAGLADFVLSAEHVALLGQLVQISDGSCVSIEVKHGLPFLIEIEQNSHAA